MSPTPTGRVVPRDGALEVVLTRTFDAPITDVWDALTVSERLAPWIGTYTGNGRTGAVDFVMTAEGATEASRMEVLRCEAPTGLTVRQDVGDGEVWTLYLDLAEADGVTTLAWPSGTSPRRPPRASGRAGSTTSTGWWPPRPAATSQRSTGTTTTRRWSRITAARLRSGDSR